MAYRFVITYKETRRQFVQDKFHTPIFFLSRNLELTVEFSALSSGMANECVVSLRVLSASPLHGDWSLGSR